MTAAHLSMRGAARRLRGWGPARTPVRPIDLARGAGGAGLGILLASLLAQQVPGGSESLPFIVAPMGASAVLLFAAPASPLAQPYPLLVGNVSSTLVGVTAGRAIDDAALAAATAVGVAIALMIVLRCLHPPGGACALFAALGSPAVAAQGFAFALWPIAVNTIALLAVALAVNRLTGRRYPHVADLPAPPRGPADGAPTARAGVGAADVRAVMDQLDQGLDVMPEDVVVLLRHAEERALQRRIGELRCRDLMTRDVAVVSQRDSLYRVRVLINERKVKALPVLDDDRRVVGIVTVIDLFNRDPGDLAPVRSVMSTDVVTVDEDAPVSRLIGLMADLGYRHVPVVDRDERLVGIVTRAELIAALNEQLVRGGPGSESD